ncbi:MAG: adenylate/guanylate cyclase domain-containing protein [bacterium]|nr:adenylate/guanylate cyclase domain-containing protein [bacterium]
MPDRLAPMLGRLLAAGTSQYDAGTRRRLRVLNLVSYIIAVATFLYALQYVMIDARHFAPVIYINLALVVVALLVPVMHRVHEIAAGLWLAGCECIALFALTHYLGRDAGIHVQYLVLAATPFVIFGLKRMWLVAVVVLLGLILHVVSWFSYPTKMALLKVDQQTLDLLYVNASITTVLLIAACVYYAYYLGDKAQQEVDRLLHNVLPASIVERLKEHPGEPIANKVDEASVMFIDLVGFTSLAAELGPVRTVEFLGTLFNALDELVSMHGVEKIKTIGDAYMIAAGVPETDADHLSKIARMALAVRACVEQSAACAGASIKCRIGFASGSVMAGVIGTKKFSFDVWGQTVNVASRMESYGKPDAVMVPLDVKEKLQGAFIFEHAGTKQIKGEGEIDCWYLIREKP